MKKLLALLLSLAVFFTFSPLSASAADFESPNNNVLVNKAVATFPEYAERLLNPNYSSSRARSTMERVLVVKETRPISDTEYITYAEYSDGLILLSDYEFTYNTSGSSIYYGDTFKYITIDISATGRYDGSTLGVFYLNDISYTINYGDNIYDEINIPGTPSTSNRNTTYSDRTYWPDETDERYAKVSYKLRFKVDSGYVESIITLDVGEDTALIDHYDWL